MAELKAQKVFSIEQLSEVTDAVLSTLGPDGRKLRERAQQFLQGDPDTVKQLREQVRTLETKNADLQSRLDMTSQLDAPNKRSKK